MLTAKMQQALLEAHAEGAVFAGRTVDRRGQVAHHAAPTLRALEARRLVRLSIGPDGGMMARLTEDGEHTVVLLESGNPLLVSLALRDR